jgi:thioesterase domain-containing protein
MAHQLQNQGHEVASLVLMDSPVPVSSSKPTALDEAELVALLVTRLGDNIGKNLPRSYEEVRQLKPAEQLNYLLEHVSLEEVRRLGLTEQLAHLVEQTEATNVEPLDVRHRRVLRYLRTVKAHSQAVQSYLPSVYPNRVISFRAREKGPDYLPLRDHPAFNDPAFGWAQFSVKPIECYTVPGDHNTMVLEPHVQVLAETLRRCLNTIQAESEE